MDSKRKVDQDQSEDIQSKLAKLEDDGISYDALDTHSLRRLLLTFEKKVTKNQQMRAKFPDAPEKFMDSEVEVDEEIKKLHVVAASPELYGEVVKLKSVPTIVSLLVHENADICIDAIELLHELIDSISQSPDSDIFIDELISSQLLEVLVQTLDRLDEKQTEDFEAIHNILGIFENLLEVRPTIGTLIISKTELLRFLLGRIKAKGYDEIRLYATEILAILMQTDSAIQHEVVSKGGIDAFLIAIAQYRHNEPSSSEEKELVENLFDCLCSALLVTENRILFDKAEGIQLMILLLKSKGSLHASALKVISFALTRSITSCKRFVENLGLKTLFAAFIKTGKKKKVLSEQEYEEHLLSTISNLLLYLDPKSNEFERVLAKFTENSGEKIERLVELHEKYYGALQEADSLIEKRRIQEELDNDQVYLERLENGLFVLQLVDLILVITASNDVEIRKTVLQLLNLRNIGIDDVQKIVGEYIDNLGDTEGEKEKEQNHVFELIKNF